MLEHLLGQGIVAGKHVIVAGLVDILGRGEGSSLASRLRRLDDSTDEVAIVIEPDRAKVHGRCACALAALIGRGGTGILDTGLDERRPCVATLTAGLLEFLEAEFIVLLHLAHLFLHLQKLEAEFLDPAIKRPELLLELPDSEKLGSVDCASTTGA